MVLQERVCVIPSEKHAALLSHASNFADNVHQVWSGLCHRLLSRLGLKTTTHFFICIPMLTALAGASMANCSSSGANGCTFVAGAFENCPQTCWLSFFVCLLLFNHDGFTCYLMVG